MKVLVFDQQNDLPLSISSVKPLVKEVLTLEKRATDEVAIYFISTEEICRLHEVFFQDPSPTDCISFPLDEEEQEEYHILGEVFVCPQTAIEYVLKTQEENKEAYYQETTLYLVHGLLHLLGYDDRSEKEKKKMRAAEKRHMHHLLQCGRLLAPVPLGLKSDNQTL